MDRSKLRIFNRARLDDRLTNELLGIAHGIIADGVVTREEVEYLRKWLVSRTAVQNNPVVQNLSCRVEEILSDGILDRDEADDLLTTLRDFAGGDFELGELAKSSSLPLDDPQPVIRLEGSRFSFTGTFAFGSRKECEQAVVERGGFSGSLTQKTNYLIVGIYATESWIHSSYGRKIEKAVSMQQRGSDIAIVGEEHWQAEMKKS